MHHVIELFVSRFCDMSGTPVFDHNNLDCKWPPCYEPLSMVVLSEVPSVTSVFDASPACQKNDLDFKAFNSYQVSVQ